MKIAFKLIFILIPFLIFSQNASEIKKLDENQKQILYKLLKVDSKVSIFSYKHQQYLDSIISILPKDAFFWQQKAMPLFKQKKYEIGMEYLNKAVELDSTNHYREYRAFIKCVFQKKYHESLSEFKHLVTVNDENSVVMDHTYNFWIGLCYLQLNEFEASKSSIQKSILFGLKNNIVNPYEMFYLGIIEYEMGNYSEAIRNINKSLVEYKSFSDAKYYKALCLLNTNEKQKARELFLEAKIDFDNGYSFNEGNSLYEQFPYQVTSFMFDYTDKFFEDKN